MTKTTSVFYNHMMDVAFTVITTEPDPFKITNQELIGALLKRVAELQATVNTIDGSFGFSDTFEMTQAEAEHRQSQFLF